MLLTREALLSGALQRFVATHGKVRILSEEELCCSRAQVLARHPPGADLWIFAYGSLIWNPTFHFVERRIGQIYGMHRRFCLWTPLGRGTPERPGLMLGLERGGSCQGVGFRIAADAVGTELDAIWRREMVTGSYCPVWVRLRTAEGPVDAVTFMINSRHERYAGRLRDDEVIDAVALAEGPLGACRDYLFNTLEHLEALGMRDRGLRRLAEAVKVRRLSLA